MKRILHYMLCLLCLWIVSLIAGCSSTTSMNSENKEEQETKSAGFENATDTPVSILEYTETEDEFQVPLTKEMADNLEEASCSIIGYDEHGYYLVLSGRVVVPDEDHVIHIPKEQSVVTLYFEDTDESLPLNRVQEKIMEDGSLQWYEHFWALYNSSSSFDVYCRDAYFMDITISATDPSTNPFLTYTMESRLNGTVNPLKETVAYEYWNELRIIMAYMEDIDGIYDSYKTILSAEDWSYNLVGTYSFNYPDLDSGMKFKFQPLQNLPGNYYCQLSLNLKNDSSVSSNLMLLQENSGDPFLITEKMDSKKQISIETENGSITFEVYQDHAVLTEYSGTDASLSIPKSINNVPVTIIDHGAFANNTELQQIEFPDTLTQINSRAFYETNLKEIHLPESLEYIGYEAFGSIPIVSFKEDDIFDIDTLYLGKNVKWIGAGAFCGYCIREFIIDSINPYYMSSDGIIYTKDQSFLLACPTGKNGSLLIPDGVTGIDATAFQCNGSFDETVKNCKGITSLRISDSVQSFSCNYLPSNIESLFIGSGLKNWENISSCSKLSELTISNDNPFYQMEDGIIYNGDKTELIYCFGKEIFTELLIPETITLIHRDAFPDDIYLRELNIPAGLNLKDMEFSDLASRLYNMKNLLNINVEEGNTSFCSKDGVLFTKDLSILICYPNGKKNNEYTIPEGVTAISKYAFYNNTLIKLNLPSTLTSLKLKGEAYSNCLEFISNLSEITVSEENPIFIAEGPFLSSRLEKALLFFSGNYNNPIVYFPEGTLIIPKGTFSSSLDTDHLIEIHIPEGVTTIEADNFNNISQYDQWDILDIYLPDSLTKISDSSFLNSPGIVFHASADSYAAKFAKKKKISFETINE